MRYKNDQKVITYKTMCILQLLLLRVNLILFILLNSIHWNAFDKFLLCPFVYSHNMILMDKITQL